MILLVEKMKNPLDKMPQNLQFNQEQVDIIKETFDIDKEENPVAEGETKLHKSHINRIPVISIKDTIEGKKKNPVDKAPQNLQFNRKQVDIIKDTFEEKKKNPVDRAPQNLRFNREQVDIIKETFDIDKEENPVAEGETKLHKSHIYRIPVISTK